MPDPISNFNFVEGVNLDDSLFDPDEILAMQELSRQYLEDRYSNLDFSPVSGLHDAVVRPTSQMVLLARAFIEEFNKTRTLHDALVNNGDEAVVDSILSNFLVTRRKGKKATGTIKVSTENYTTNQSIFGTDSFVTPDGLRFFPSRNYSMTNTPSLTSDVEIFQSGSGSAGHFMIDVVAEEVGTKYNIKRGSHLEFSGSISGLISSTSINQFSGGEDNESNQSVHDRIISSLSARNMTSPLAIDQSLRESFPDIVTTVSHGVSSDYMKRNAHNLFGVKSGCFCDVYVRNAYAPKIKEIHAVASRIADGSLEAGDQNQYSGMFLVSISKDDFPGHYDVISVRPITNNKIIGSYEIFKKTRVLTDLQTQNELHSVAEAAFSRYSSTDVIFAESPSSLLDEISVVCEVQGLDEIKEMQEYANGGGTQSALIDTLIKACVPCFISIDPITVRVRADSLITDSEISAKIASYILTVNPADDVLRSDVVVSKILEMDGVVGVDLPIKMNASILVPSENEEVISFSSISSLVIPSHPSKFVGAETVGFFVKDDSININTVRVK
jgi:hypothetical protein